MENFGDYSVWGNVLLISVLLLSVIAANTLKRMINPDADIITEHYTKKSDGWWRSLMSLPSRRVEAEGSDEDKISFSV